MTAWLFGKQPSSSRLRLPKQPPIPALAYSAIDRAPSSHDARAAVRGQSKKS